MSHLRVDVGAPVKVGYSFVGLLGGYLATFTSFGLMEFYGFLVSLQSRPRSSSFTMNTDAVLVLTVYAMVFSLPVWLLIGVPAVLLIPSRIAAGMFPLLRVAIGAVLGLLGEALIWAVLDHGVSLNWHEIWSGKAFWIVAAVTSITAFEIYCWLTRRKLQSANAQ
jgi:hypothetical protein